MRTYPSAPFASINPEDTPVAYKVLQYIDEATSVCPAAYIKAKGHLVHEYFTEHNVTGVVIGISGGIDSAVAYKLLVAIKEQYGTNFDIYPVFVQDNYCKYSWKRARELAPNVRRINAKRSDMDNNTRSMVRRMNEGTGSKDKVRKTDKDQLWAIGQGISYERQSTMYTLASFISSKNPGVTLVIGTINKDEGSYIGYTCKAGDGMVDVQLIADIDKRQVYQLAVELNVPQSIIDAAPAGDMYDKRTDEVVFGACYNMLRLYTNLLDHRFSHLAEELYEASSSERDILSNGFKNIENLHRFNAHKYMVGSPAVYLDVLPVNAPGGRSNNLTLRNTPEDSYTSLSSNRSVELSKGTAMHPNMLIVNGIDPVIVDAMNNGGGFERHLQYSTNTYGYGDDMGGGSLRVTETNASIADSLYATLLGTIDNIIFIDGKPYVFAGVNEYLRYVEYTAGDGTQLVPHLDGRYVSPTGDVAALTVLVYLSDCDGGDTRIIRNCNAVDRVAPGDNRADWSRMATDDEVEMSVRPKSGNIFVFDGYDQFHDAIPVREGSANKRIIITEAMFRPLNIPQAEGNDTIIETLERLK